MFFDEVDEFLSEKPCTEPKVVINSSQIFIGDGTGSRTENCEEEGEGTVENIVPNLPSSSSSSDDNNINNRGQNSKCPESQKLLV